MDDIDDFDDGGDDSAVHDHCNNDDDDDDDGDGDDNHGDDSDIRCKNAKPRKKQPKYFASKNNTRRNKTTYR